MDNRSRKELMAWLTQIIDNELNKSDDQIDMDLILECSDYLDELQKENYFYKERDIQAKIAIIKKEVENSTSDNKTARIIRNKHSFSLRKKIVLAIVAAFIVTLLALTAVAHAQNYSSLLNFIKDHIAQIRNMPSNDAIEENDVTVTKSNETIWYDSINELLITENTNILYPDPSTCISINSIHKSQFENDVYRITILFDAAKSQITIDNHYISDYSQWADAEVYICNNKSFYLLPCESFYQASCQYSGYEYTITSDTRDSLIEIINNLKEYQP